MSEENKIEQQNIHQEELMLKYLNGELTQQEAHAFEEQMANSPMLNDAVEGLSSVKNANQIDGYVKELNMQLKNYTSSKTKKRKRGIEVNYIVIVAIVLMIVFCVLGYWVIKHLN